MRLENADTDTALRVEMYGDKLPFSLIPTIIYNF